MLAVVTSITMRTHVHIPRITKQVAMFGLDAAPAALRWWARRDAQLPVHFER